MQISSANKSIFNLIEGTRKAYREIWKHDRRGIPSNRSGEN